MAASLGEMLDLYSLKKEDLLRECPREIRIGIALKLTDWKVFGNILLIPKETLAAIDAQNQTEEQKKIALLDSWHERASKYATNIKLAEKLYQHNRRDLVTHLCELLKSHMIEPKPAESKNVAVSDPMLEEQTHSAGITYISVRV